MTFLGKALILHYGRHCRGFYISFSLQPTHSGFFAGKGRHRLKKASIVSHSREPLT